MTSKQEKYEQAMEEIGDFGWYQKKLFLLLSLSVLPSGCFTMALIFTAANPLHRCYLSQIENRSGAFYFDNVSLYIPYENSNGTQFQRLSQCEMFNVTDVVNCQNGWVFDTKNGRTSIVTDFELVCDRKWIRPLPGTLLMFGVLVGGLVSGSIADTWGRKPTFLVSNLLRFAVWAVSAFSNGVLMYCACLFLTGAFSIITGGTAFIMATEMIHTKGRVAVGVICIGSFAFGYMLLPVFAYLIPSWRNLTLSISAIGIIFIPYIWLIPESPRWLFAQGKEAEFKKVFCEIARTNGSGSNADRILERLFDKNVIDCCEKNKNSKPTDTGHVEYSYLDLLRTNNMRLRTICMWIIWSVCSLVYYCLGLNTSNIGGNPFINCFVAAAVEIPAYTLTIVALTLTGRRKVTLAVTLLISGMSCFAIPYFYKSNLTLMSVAIAMTGKLTVSSSFIIAYVFCSELYPTLIRTIGLFSASMAARIAGMTVPYLLFMGEHYHILPYLIMGSLSIVAVIATGILPETGNEILPNTIEDLPRIDFRRFGQIKRSG